MHERKNENMDIRNKREKLIVWLKQLTSQQEEIKVDRESHIETVRVQDTESVEEDTIAYTEIKEENPMTGKVIFLDFNGVMTTGYYNYMLMCKRMPKADEYGNFFDPESVKWLGYILEHTNADIIVTSDWKERLSKQQLIQMWQSRELPGRIYDTTLLCQSFKGDEISDWIMNNSISNYVILDTRHESQFYTDQTHHLVAINPNRGIDVTAAKKAVRILNV